MAGRDLDRFVKMDADWKIIHRTGMTDWIRLEAPSSRDMVGFEPETQGQRAPNDLSYRFRVS